MEVKELPLKGAKLITPSIFPDERGFFLQIHQMQEYARSAITTPFVQDNHSYSRRGTLRGMHFQRRPGQVKLIYVLIGTIYDVIVDMRPDSPTFGKWEGVYLDDQGKKQLLVPIGFAHGFCVMSEEAHVMYKVSAPYIRGEEREFRFDDPKIGIEWPLKVPHLSKRDREAPTFEEVMKT